MKEAAPSEAASKRLDYFGFPFFAGGGPRLFCVHMPPEQLPFPFMIPADASTVKIGAGIDRLKTAKATDANPAITHFMNATS
jgi:hypothetical protein